MSTQTPLYVPKAVWELIPYRFGFNHTDDANEQDKDSQRVEHFEEGGDLET